MLAELGAVAGLLSADHAAACQVRAEVASVATALEQEFLEADRRAADREREHAGLIVEARVCVHTVYQYAELKWEFIHCVSVHRSEYTLVMQGERSLSLLHSRASNPRGTHQ